MESETSMVSAVGAVRAAARQASTAREVAFIALLSDAQLWAGCKRCVDARAPSGDASP